jgi:hypothetical protein
MWHVWGEKRNTCRDLVRKPKGKNCLESLGVWWEDYMKWGLREMGLDVVYWIIVTVDTNRWQAVVHTVMNIRATQRAGNFLTNWGNRSFSRRSPLNRDSLLFFFQWLYSPLGGPRPPHFFRGFKITLRYTTLGRIPLDKWSARRRDLYLTTVFYLGS